MSEGKGSNKLLIILLVLIIAILISVSAFFSYYFFVKPGASTQNTNSSKNIAEKTLALGEFIVNLADENETKYLKTEVYLAYSDTEAKKIEKEVNNKMPQIKEKISVTLGKKTSENFNAQYLDKIKKELTDQINTLLDEGKITNVYLNDFIIQ